MKFPRARCTPVTALLLATIFGSSCSRHAGLPTADAPQYRELVTAFYVGVAALQSGDDTRAEEKLRLSTKLAPGEPASWADLGLLSARQQDFDAAYTNVDHARSLMPENSSI